MTRGGHIAAVSFRLRSPPDLYLFRHPQVPNELGRSDGEILEQSLSDNASLNEDMISVDFSFDMTLVIGRFAMKVLIAVASNGIMSFIQKW